MSGKVIDNISDAGNLKWWILLTVIIGTFLGRLDQTIVSLAVPKIMIDFGITVSQAGWISTAYIIANAIFVPVWGKLGDLIGRKKVYVAGFSIFIFGSVLCGLAWSFGSMIVFRVVQAIAVSADYPTAMAIITLTFKEGRERAQALGIWTSVFAASAICGPLIGGPLVDNFGWPAVFFLNLPVGVLGLIMALTFIHESRSGQEKIAFDWWGAISLGVALSTFVLVLDKGSDWGWASFNSYLCYFITIAAGHVFYRIEKKSPDPIIDLNFFRNKIFSSTLINNFIIFMGFIGVIFTIPVFAQIFLGYTATQTGYLFIPLAFCMMLSAPIGGRLTGKVEPRWIIMISTGVAAAGLALLQGLDAKSTAWDIIYPLMVMALGMGFGMAQRTNIIAAAVPKEQIGSASSVLALARNIAGAFGIAIFTTILKRATENSVLDLAKYSVINFKNSVEFSQAVGLINLKAQIMGFKTVFLISSFIVFAGALFSYRIRIPKDQELGKIVVE